MALVPQWRLDLQENVRQINRSLAAFERKLEEMSMRLESNRRNTLECMLGQQRAEEELRKLRVLASAAELHKQLGQIATAAVERPAPKPAVKPKPVRKRR